MAVSVPPRRRDGRLVPARGRLGRHAARHRRPCRCRAPDRERPADHPGRSARPPARPPQTCSARSAPAKGVPARSVTPRITPPLPARAPGRKQRTSTAEPHRHPPARRGCPPQQRPAPCHHDSGTGEEVPPVAPPGYQSDEYELSEEDREWARRMVAGLPPLTDRQRDLLGLLLRKRR